MTGMDRRAFLSRGAALAGGSLVAAGSLQTLTARLAGAVPGAALGQEKKGSYGPLRPVVADNERGGFAYLALPDGFSYVVLSRIGDPMSDGNATPAQLDGMAAFTGPDGTVRLIRNHEIRSAAQVQVGGPLETRYDPSAGGGTTTLDYDPHGRELVRDFVSLNGTIVNCAGGKGLGDRSWITGEEIITTVGDKKHGYNFEVPLARSGPALTQPIVAMGRYAHEAVATDPASGIVYETEDAGSGRGSGFYRYLPNDPRSLLAGGRLQMLAVTGLPKADLRDGEVPGVAQDVTWVDIDTPDADPLAATNADGLAPGTSGTFAEGYAKGGAKFNRLEGTWYGDGSIFFDSTSGGDAKNPDAPNADGYREGYGQIWEYRPRSRQLVLLYQSPGADALDSPDNLVVTPRGGLLLCEDDASSDGDTHPLAPGITDVNRLVGLTRTGEAFEFGINRFNDSELAGACFSPDGKTLFANIFGDGSAGSGMTVAIRGPWARGAL
ncbi:MAG: PhoX family protein [Actinomycetota bacterium]|nr:PhoX family protein [Actinomycetota bacterium]